MGSKRIEMRNECLIRYPITEIIRLAADLISYHPYTISLSTTVSPH